MPPKVSLKYLLLTSCLLAVPGSAQPQALDRAKLIALVPLPKMEAGFSLNFTSNDAPPDDAAARAEIGRLKKVTPETSDQLLRLGQLYSQINDQTHAKESADRAVAILRNAVATKPQDAGLLLRLGAALRQNDQLSEAETTLRHSLKIAPRNPHIWSKLGEVLVAEATHEVVPSPQQLKFGLGTMPSLQGLSAALLTSRPKPEAVSRAQAELEEARSNYAHALQLAPQDVEVNQDNIGFQLGSIFVTALLKGLETSRDAALKDILGTASQAVAGAFLSPTLFSSIQNLAKLKPADASLQGIAGLSALLSYLTVAGGEIPLQGGLKSLPTATAVPVSDAIAKLEAIVKAGGKDAPAALESLGGLYFMLGNSAAPERLKRAIALDPARQQAWEMLAGIMASKDQFAELAGLVETRLKTQDTARNHMLLAKAYDKLGRPADAAALVDLALKVDSKDVTANLAKTALLLRAGEAAKANAQLAAISPVPDSQKSDYTLLEGAAFALQGKLDEARTNWEKVLAAESSNEAATQMLANLPTR